MISHKTTVLIQKPLEEVFKFVATDYFQNHPKWDRRVVKMETSGPVAKGAKGKETRRQMNMKNTYDFEVTEYVPNTRMAFRATSGSAGYSMAFDFKAVDGKTELTLSAELVLNGFMKLIEWMIRGNFRQEIDKNAREIKRMIEA